MALVLGSAIKLVIRLLKKSFRPSSDLKEINTYIDKLTVSFTYYVSVAMEGVANGS